MPYDDDDRKLMQRAFDDGCTDKFWRKTFGVNAALEWIDMQRTWLTTTQASYVRTGRIDNGHGARWCRQGGLLDNAGRPTLLYRALRAHHLGLRRAQ